MFIGRCAVVLEAFLLALHTCKSHNAHSLVRTGVQLHTGAFTPHVESDPLDSWGLISSQQSLIGWPQPEDMWLCLGAC